jgi:hypothetical protein
MRAVRRERGVQRELFDGSAAADAACTPTITTEPELVD